MIIATRQHPWIIDLEASGFGPHSYPIEIGLAMAPGERYCSLIKPVEEWTHWSDEAQGYHQISRHTLFQHGKSIEEVADDVNRLLKDQTVYSDGWVVDQPWLIRLFHQARKPILFRISPLEMILSEVQMEIWHQTKDLVTQELGLNRHRASNDALIIQKTYLRTLSLAQSDRSTRAI